MMTGIPARLDGSYERLKEVHKLPQTSPQNKRAYWRVTVGRAVKLRPNDPVAAELGRLGNELLGSHQNTAEARANSVRMNATNEGVLTINGRQIRNLSVQQKLDVKLYWWAARLASAGGAVDRICRPFDSLGTSRRQGPRITVEVDEPTGRGRTRNRAVEAGSSSRSRSPKGKEEMYPDSEDEGLSVKPMMVEDSEADIRQWHTSSSPVSSEELGPFVPNPAGVSLPTVSDLMPAARATANAVKAMTESSEEKSRELEMPTPNALYPTARRLATGMSNLLAETDAAIAKSKKARDGLKEETKLWQQECWKQVDEMDEVASEDESSS